MKKIRILMLALVIVLVSVANVCADIPTATFTVEGQTFNIPLLQTGHAYFFGSADGWNLNTSDYNVQLTGFMDYDYKTTGATIAYNLNLVNSTTENESFLFAFHLPNVNRSYPASRLIAFSSLRITVNGPYNPFTDVLIAPFNQPFLQVNSNIAGSWGTGNFDTINANHGVPVAFQGFGPGGSGFFDETLAFSLVGNANVFIGSYAYIVPIPPSALLFGSCLSGLLGIARLKGIRRKNT